MKKNVKNCKKGQNTYDFIWRRTCLHSIFVKKK